MKRTDVTSLVCDETATAITSCETTPNPRVSPIHKAVMKQEKYQDVNQGHVRMSEQNERNGS